MIAKFKDPSIWGPHLAVAAAYAACYEVVRYFTSTHWILPAGLRLVCLLLVPRRFWPAMIFGESLPIAEKILLANHNYGIAWTVLVAIPPMLLSAPIVAALKKRMTLIRDDGEVNMTFILAATLLAATATMSLNSIAYATVVMPDGAPSPGLSLIMVLTFFIGNYLGALTITPSVLALKERVDATKGSLTWSHIAKSPLLREILCVEGPILLALVAAVHFLDGSATPYLRLSMSLPVILLAWRHHWHGAAIGGMLASIAVAASAIATRDPSMIPAQAVLAFVISGSLAVGAWLARRSRSTITVDAKVSRASTLSSR